MMRNSTTLLIVDDSSIARGSYIDSLRSQSESAYCFVEADCLQAARDLWNTAKPDLVLLDLRLPDGNGLQLLEHIRSASSDPQLPVVVLTGYADGRAAVQAMKLGAIDFVLKEDVTAALLSEIVAQACDRCALAKQLQRSQQREAMIAEISLRIREYFTLADILPAVVREVQAFLAADRVVIYQFNPDRSGVVVAESVLTAWPSSLNAGVTDVWFSEPQEQAYQEGQIFVAHDVATVHVSASYRQWLQQLQVRSQLVVPILLVNGSSRLWGLLMVHQCAAPRPWDDTDMRLLQQLAVQVAIAIQQATLYEDLRTLNGSLEQQVAERTTQLAASEATTRALVESVPDLLIRTNRQGEYLEMLNGESVKRVILPPDPTVPYTVYDLLPEPLASKRFQQMQRAFETGAVQIEEQYIEIDGEWRWEEVRVKPIHENELLVMVRDITDRKRAELLLRQSEARNRAIVSAIPDLLIRVDAEGRYLDYVSGRYTFDLVPLEIDTIGQRFVDLLPPEIAQPILAAVQRALATQEVQLHEQQICVGDQIRYEEVRVVCSGDREALLVIRDITDRKRAERLLRQSEARKRAILEAIPDLLILADRTGHYLDVISPDRDFDLIVPRSALVGQPIAAVLPPPMAQRQLDAIRRAFDPEGLQIYEQVIEVGDRLQHEEVRVIPSGDDEVLFIIRDISDRKHAEQALQQLNQDLEAKVARRTAQLQHLTERLTLALDAGAIGCWDYDIQQQTVFWDKRQHELYGISPAVDAMVDYRVWLEALHPDDLTSAQALFQHAIAGQAAYDTEFRVVHADGSIHHIKSYGRLICDPAGQPQRMIGVNFDISDRKLAEQELRDQEERWQLALRGSNASLWDWDLVRNTIFRSSRWWQLRGLEADTTNAAVEEWTARIHPTDRDRVLAALQNHLDQKTDFYQAEYRICHADGSYRWILDRGQALWDDAGMPVRIIGSEMDITARKQAEAALTESEATNRALVEAIPDLLVRMRQDGRNVQVINQQAIHALPHNTDITGLAVTDVLPPAIAQERLTLAQQAIQTGQVQYHEYHFVDQGQPYYEEARIVPLHDQDVLVVVRDITARKCAEEQRQLAELKLRQSEAALAEAQRIAHVGSWELDVVTLQLTWSAELFHIFGFDPNDPEPAYAEHFNYIHPEDRVRLQGHIDRATQDGTPYSLELRISQPDGSYRYLDARGQAQFNAQGRVEKLMGTALDITDRKQIEAALRRQGEELKYTIEELRLTEEELQTQMAELVAAQRTIALERSRYQDLFDGAPDAYLVTDPQGYILVANQMAQRLFKRLHTKDTDRSLTALIHPADYERFCHALTQLTTLTSTSFGPLEIQLKAKSEQPITVSMRVAVLTDALQMQSLRWIIRDISQEKQTALELQKLSERLALAIRSGAIGCWDWHLQDNVVIWDERMYELYGVPAVNEQGALPYEVWASGVHPDDRAATEALLQQALLGEVAYDPEFRVVHPDGSIHYIKAYGMVLYDAAGQPQSMIGINYDISDRKLAEAQLQQTNAELIRATRLKDEFLANMSHELRTPLNAILGMSEALQDQIFGVLNEQQQNSVNLIAKSGQHLLDLINDILDLAKISAGKVELQWDAASVQSLCDSSLLFVQQQAFQKDIQLTHHVPSGLDSIWVDERRVRQVLINLLNNAVKFTPNGGRVSLQVAVGSGQHWLGSATIPANLLGATSPLILFQVTDTGIGIAPDDLKGLFQPFMQVDRGLNRQHEGTGLGLALVKQIAELHGGSVVVCSQPGQGSCFTVALPYQQGGSMTPAAAPNVLQLTTLPTDAESPAIAPLILLAEDNEANIATFSSYLKARQYRLLVARDGLEAVALAKAEQPDLILMDVQLPQIDGLEAIRQIRAEPRLATTPIIALTAFAMVADRDRCLAAGATAYFSKPVRLRHLVETIGQLCRSLTCSS